MSDSSPFDDAPEAQYEDAPVDQHEEKEEEEEEEEEEEPSVEVEEEDPFADVPAPSAQSSQSSAPSLDSAFAPEPEVEQETALSIWEAERADILRERQSKADSEKQQQLATAKEEISKFYEDQESKLEKTKKVNRADEKNYRNDTAAIFEKGTKWEKVNRLVNVVPKVGEKPGSSRVERYRKLLTTLKGEKDKKKASV